MLKRRVHINEWDVDYIFMPYGYEPDVVLDSLRWAHSPKAIMREAVDIMSGLNVLDGGFTYVNSRKRKAVVVIGPSSSGGEMIDTFVHETYHLAVNVAESYGYDLTGELPAYLVGDLARQFADVICTMGRELYARLYSIS